MTRSGLGRGLSALLPDAAGGQASELPLTAIRPNPYQPRRAFDDERLQELAESLRQHGLLQPITVRPAPTGEGWQLVAGERRWRAAQLAGLTTLPALVRACSDRQMIEMALVENLQRDDLNALEAAEAYRRCLDEFGLTQEELAQRVGKSRAAVANTLRLLKLDPTVQELVRDGGLGEGHGRALLAWVTAEEQRAMARRILDETLSVREVEALSRSAPARRPRPVPRPLRDGVDEDPDVTAYTRRLERALGAPVVVRPDTDGGGTVTLRYFSVEDLERLAALLHA